VSRGASPKKQRRSYSGKKKRHTQKAQVVADQKTKHILATAFSAGKTHDFTLFERSRTAIPRRTKCLADSGYLGLVKHHPLTTEQKVENRQLARERFVAEHIIRSLKIFRILSERYRSRRKRFGLRFNLIAALYNYELND